MDCKINWTPRAWATFEANIRYLAEYWTSREIDLFIVAVEKKLDNLSKHPRIGSSRNQKFPNVRHTLVHKRVALIYKHKPAKNEIDLLVFWNTYLNPKKLRVQ